LSSDTCLQNSSTTNTVPDVEVEDAGNYVRFTSASSLIIDFLEYKDNILYFKFSFSASIQDYPNCSARFTEIPVVNFRSINDATTLTVVTEGQNLGPA